MFNMATPILFKRKGMVNDVTIGDGGVHERIAPLIMKSIHNKSNQPIIVRRGIQVPEKRKSPFFNPIQMKKEGDTTDTQSIHSGDIDPNQQFLVYQLQNHN